MRRAFTLLEMLVVIAVLAILAAIFFPVMAAVGERARSSVCSTNMQQLGLAWRMYADDYDGTFFWQARWDEEVDLVHWGRLYRTHIRWPFALYPYLRTVAVTKCPSDIAQPNWRMIGPWWLSYGPNLVLSLGYPEGVGGRPRHEAEIENPAGVIALAESISGFGCCEPWNVAYFRTANYYGQGPRWGGPEQWYVYRDEADHGIRMGLTDAAFAPYCRHGAGNHAVMLDGHVEWLRWNAVGDADSPAWRAMLGVTN